MRRAGRRRAAARTLGVLASAGAHLGLGVLLVWRLGRPIELPPPPVMNVELASLPPSAEPPPPAAPPRAHRPTAARTALAPAPLAPTPAAPPQAAPPVLAAPAADDQAARQALRGLVGCDHAGLMRLSPQEREACERRLARADPGPGPRLDLDPKGEFYRDDTPYLARKPKNGCKIGAGGREGAGGAQGAAIGINCAWKF